MNTKNKILLAATITSALIAIAGPKASANTLVLDYGTHHSGVGGEFNAYTPFLNPVSIGYASAAMANVGSGGTGFETFCVEYNEHFNPGHTYTYAISNAALLGGNGGPSDPLSKGSAWLYSNFAHDTSFDGFVTYLHTNTDAGLLQTALWWLENENGLSYDPLNKFEVAVVAKFGSDVNAMADNAHFGYSVGVLNLWINPDFTGFVQDQLVLVPDSGTTVMLLGLALVGLFAAGRKLCLLKA
jgi:hypothetical protein